MSEGIGSVLQTLLVEALPGLFGGANPAVRIEPASDLLVLDPQSADAVAGAALPDDRTDRLPYNRADPDASYSLTQTPYPGPRRVRLTTAAGDVLSLRADEVVWEAGNPRVFRLRPRPTRDLSAVSGVDVLYGVTAIFTRLKALRTLAFDLHADDATKLDQVEALVLAVVTLERPRLIDSARATYEDGDYGAEVEVKSVKLQRGERVAENQRRLTLLAELEIKVRRALAEDEGTPIRRIVTPGLPHDPERPVDIRADLDL